jgi:FlaA1/EpsC-like NDP-sugar epimerase
MGVDIVFHTAALKHVTKCEQQPREAVNTNVVGAWNVINACIKNKVDVCVNISSDKACECSCVYGNTKAICEALFTEANNMTLHTDFYSVRSGNIFASQGSVIKIWKTQVEKENRILLTDPGMTRFFITVGDAVKLTLKSIDLADRGEVFVFRMPSFLVGQLADLFIEKFGDQNTEKKIIGKFEGEKDYETLFTGQEAGRMKRTGEFFIVYPSMDIKTVSPFRTDKNEKFAKGYTSKQAKGTKRELQKMFETILK